MSKRRKHVAKCKGEKEQSAPVENSPPSFCICQKHKMNGTMLLFTFFCPLNIYNNLYMDQRCSLHKMNNPQGPKCKTPRATSMQDHLTKWAALLHSAENFTPKPYRACGHLSKNAKGANGRG